MATVNTPITKTWTKVAEDSADPVLVQAVEDTALEIATTATDVAPATTLVGHRLVGAELAAIRAVIGPGFVWARIAPRATIAAATVVVSS